MQRGISKCSVELRNVVWHPEMQCGISRVSAASRNLVPTSRSLSGKHKRTVKFQNATLQLKRTRQISKFSAEISRSALLSGIQCGIAEFFGSFANVIQETRTFRNVCDFRVKTANVPDHSSILRGNPNFCGFSESFTQGFSQSFTHPRSLCRVFLTQFNRPWQAPLSLVPVFLGINGSRACGNCG